MRVAWPRHRGGGRGKGAGGRGEASGRGAGYPSGRGAAPDASERPVVVEVSSGDEAPAGRSPDSSSPPVFVVWHKWTDLRLRDSEPVAEAHRRAASARGRVLHLHLVERELLVGRTRVAGIPRCSARRAAFWLESVQDLAGSLEGSGQQLLVLADDAPEEASAKRPPWGSGAAAVFSRLCGALPVRAVFAHREVCDEELQAEAAVRKALEATGASLELLWGGITTHHIEDLGFNATSPREMPDLYQPFLKKVRGRPVRRPVDAARLRPPPEALGRLGGAGAAAAAAVFAALGAPAPWAPPPPGVGLAQKVDWVGGETAAWKHIQKFMWDEDRLRDYVGATDSMTPGESNAINSGTRLSPWLAFGCITARQVVHEVRRYERARGKSRSTYWVYHELVFRDFFRFALLTWRVSLFKLKGPYGVTGLEWSRDMELFDKWRAGKTGFPFVDAGMRELAATGYISHLHRQCAAAFLVRDLRLDWRMGAEHFEAMLLDHTPDANYGNWAYRILQRPQLVAAGCPVKEHLTTVEIVAWPVVHDASLVHTLAWLPELRGLPRDYAREPWRLETVSKARIRVKPYKDSPLWFCSVNRMNWQEYSWMSGFAWTVAPAASSASSTKAGSFVLGREYPRPLVPPLSVEVDLNTLPVDHAWGDTAADERPHVRGRPGRYCGAPGPAPGQAAPAQALPAAAPPAAAPRARLVAAVAAEADEADAAAERPAASGRRRWAPKRPRSPGPQGAVAEPALGA